MVERREKVRAVVLSEGTPGLFEKKKKKKVLGCQRGRVHLEPAQKGDPLLCWVRSVRGRGL